MKKWEEVTTNPKLALTGVYDSSLIPKKHKDSMQEIEKEVKEEIEKAMLFQ